jgi:hypothetical protein
VSQDKDPKAAPSPATGVKPAAKTILGMASPVDDLSDLERTREIRPDSKIATSWPRPAPRSVRPGAPAQAQPASTAPRPSLGGDMFPGLPRPSSRPPQTEAQARPEPVAPPLEAPRPPAPSVEEISNSQLMADDSGPAPAFEAEELSGSVLVEEPPDGQGPLVVTRLGEPGPEQPGQPLQEARAVEPAHRALLGLPHLPKSTPAPVLSRMPQPSVVIREMPSDPAGAAPAPPGYEAAYGEAEAGAEAYPPASYEDGGAAGLHDDVELTELPKTGLRALADRGTALVDRVRATLLASADEKPGRRPRWMLPAVTVAGLFVGVALAGVLFSLSGSRKGAGAAAPAERAASGPAKPEPSSPAASTLSAPSAAAPSPALAACSLAGAVRLVAPTALVAAGVEVRPFGESVALGFASGEHEATAVRLDPTSLATIGSASTHSADPIRRVRPVAAPKDALGLVVDADRKHDQVHGRRTLPLDPPLQAGASGADVVWTHAGGQPAGRLWTLDSTDEIDALRAASEGAPGDTTTVIAFRRGSAIWVGATAGYKALAPKGGLSRIDGLGTAIGSPAVAISDGVIMIAWADRSSSDAPWRLRIAHMKAGDAASEPVAFSPPAGGPGGHVMSPGLAAVPGGRFLLVWTEGPTSKQRVRGITLSPSGEPAGKPLEISSEGINSGQGQAAVTAAPGARGVVTFLQARDDGFEVAATPIACGS